MGPAERDNDVTRKLLAGGGGFEPPLRGPEPRVLPLDDPPPTHPTLPHPPMNHGPGSTGSHGSANRRLERAARAEARHLGRRNLDLLAGARVAPVAGRAARDDEGA